MDQASADLLRGLLKDVSRSFYLTLRVLPGGLDRPIGLAYLLARASDTIADTDAVPKEQRLAVLQAFAGRLSQPTPPLDLAVLAGQQSSPAERILLQRLNEAFELLGALDSADQERIRAVLHTILSGQMLDVERFAEADVHHIAALASDEELDEYTYRVAGCVGEFWTRMCQAHLFAEAHLDEALLLSNGVRFGKGLQLINVLRDIPADLRLGRCYLPRQRLAQLQLTPADLLDPANEARLRPLYNSYLDLAEEHLRAGWRYTNQLPFRSVRVRLACAWPILIGVQTLQRLRQSPVLEPARRIKISRQDVRGIVVRTVFWYPWRSRWQRLWPDVQPGTETRCHLGLL